MGFASISVPPVVDEYDLLLYCRLDLQHDGCLRKCGFTVQFNMRDFVCKNNYKTVPFHSDLSDKILKYYFNMILFEELYM